MAGPERYKSDEEIALQSYRDARFCGIVTAVVFLIIAAIVIGFISKWA